MFLRIRLLKSSLTNQTVAFYTPALLIPPKPLPPCLMVHSDKKGKKTKTEAVSLQASITQQCYPFLLRQAFVEGDC